MDRWHPVSAEELDAILAAQIIELTQPQRERFERIKVAPHLVAIHRFGKVEWVFVVARVGDCVVYYEDVEEGFNVSALSSGGSISAPGHEQWELGHVLERLASA